MDGTVGEASLGAWVALAPFQELMCQWRRSHPYNAAHAMVLRGPADVDRLGAAIAEVYERTGLGELVPDPQHRRMRWLPSASVELVQRPGRREADWDFSALHSDELERPFDDPGRFPFRWTVQESGEGGSHVLGLTYDHFVGDAHAVQALIAEVLHAYLTPDSQDPRLRTRRVQPNEHTLRRVGLVRTIRSGMGTVARYLRLRHAHRMRERRDAGPETGVVTRSLVHDGSRGASAMADGIAGGWNDLFLAAVALAIAEHTPARRTHRQRRALALGTIVSLRDRCQFDGTVDFSCRLAHRSVMIRRPDEGPKSVLRQVVDQTAEFKGVRSPCSAIEPGLVRTLWPLLRIRDDRAGYRKFFPLCAGVSTVVVDPRWYGRAAERVVRVVRSCPTGPAVPLVLAPTLFRNRIELSLTFRRACFSKSEAEKLLESVVVNMTGSGWVGSSEHPLVEATAARAASGRRRDEATVRDDFSPRT